VNANVSPQLGGNGEAFVAPVAGVRPVAGVQFGMQPERAVAEEAFGALRALVPPLFAVHPPVFVQVDLLAETLPLNDTDKHKQNLANDQKNCICACACILHCCT